MFGLFKKEKIVTLKKKKKPGAGPDYEPGFNISLKVPDNYINRTYRLDVKLSILNDSIIPDRLDSGIVLDVQLVQILKFSGSVSFIYQPTFKTAEFKLLYLSIDYPTEYFKKADGEFRRYRIGSLHTLYIKLEGENPNSNTVDWSSVDKCLNEMNKVMDTAFPVDPRFKR